MYCCSHITDGKTEHKALWALAGGHRRGLFWLKGLAWLPWEGDNGALPPRFQNINLTKPEPSKPRLPSPQILPSFSAFSGNKLIQIFLQRSNSHIYPQASPMSCPSPPAVILLLGFRVNIQGTFCPKPPEMVGTVNTVISERLSAAGRQRKATSDALFLPNRRAHVPMTPASQGLLGSSSKAW